MLSPVEIALAVAAFAAGWTGTWSPCGFSMVETLGPTGHRGGMPTTLAACVAFLPGALLGGALTFCALSALGSLAGAGGPAAHAVAAAIAAGGALLELRGARIVPQVRRQLPEHWRRVMPMPVAAALYGILLGLGFTTFVLTFAVWALAAIAFALGDPALGLVVGLAFGIGRALPVVALAPLAGRPLGVRAVALMAERPLVYRGFRLGDGALLAACAVVLAVTPSAVAAKVEIPGGADPTVAPGALAWQAPDGSGYLLRDGGYAALPGHQPAVGGPYVAILVGDAINLLDRYTLATVASVPARGADGLAVSGRWLAYRVGGRRGDRIAARRIGPAGLGGAKTIARSGGFVQLSRPSLDHGLLVFARNGRRASRLVKRRLAARRNRTILRSRSAGLFNPSVRGRRIAYVRSAKGRDRLMVRRKRGHGRGHAVHSRRRARGWIWSTALSRRRVFFTVLRSARGHASMLSVRLGHRR